MKSSNYLKYRGQCKTLVDELIAKDPTLRAVRGHYDCPLWGRQAHWWAEKPDGTIVDPSAKQFPFEGSVGEYIEFNGVVACAECRKEMPEKEAKFYGNYAFCSTECICKFVGLEITDES